MDVLTVRGKRLDRENEWVEGHYFKSGLTAEFQVDPKHGAFFGTDRRRHCIADEHGVVFEVDPSTLELILAPGVAGKRSDLTFGQAIEAIKRGSKVARDGWNGKGMFLFLLSAGTIPKAAIHDPKLREVLENSGKDYFEALASIRMKTADGKILTGWLASQTDMLAEDWMIVE